MWNDQYFYLLTSRKGLPAWFFQNICVCFFLILSHYTYILLIIVNNYYFSKTLSDFTVLLDSSPCSGNSLKNSCLLLYFILQLHRRQHNIFFLCFQLFVNTIKSLCQHVSVHLCLKRNKKGFVRIRGPVQLLHLFFMLI